MSSFNVVDASNQLAALIDRAVAGEPILITRCGEPIVELKPVRQERGAVSADDMDWLAGHRISGRGPLQDAGELVSGMRDDEDR